MLTPNFFDLSRTVAALKVYDEADEALTAMTTANSNKEFLDQFTKLEELDKAVGAAYGEDTKGLNDPETCRKYVKAGCKVPPAGSSLSFVRRMAAKFLSKTHS